MHMGRSLSELIYVSVQHLAETQQRRGVSACLQGLANPAGLLAVPPAQLQGVDHRRSDQAS